MKQVHREQIAPLEKVGRCPQYEEEKLSDSLPKMSQVSSQADTLLKKRSLC